MNVDLFREFLSSKGCTEEEITQQVEKISSMEVILQKHIPLWPLEDMNAAATQTLVDEMIDFGENTLENFWVLMRYARAIGNNDLYISIFELLDGYEAMENLYAQLAERVGEDLRDMIFDGLSLPPLGLSKREKARYTHRVMRRMVNVFEGHYCREILADSLRDLPDEYYQTAKLDYFETCEGDLDRYLQFRREKFIDNLKMHQTQGALFFGQEITDAVIHFVNSNIEMGGGVCTGKVIYETKIPFNTKAYLDEKDPELRRYYYCHCPWVRESLRRTTFKVSPIFCQCSAGFHKRHWEVIFGKKLKAEVLESILQGDERCRFAIHLPEDYDLI